MNKKVLIVMLIVLCIDALFIALTVQDSIYAKDYIKTDAEVVSVDVKQHKKSNERYINIIYTVDEQQYSSDMRVFLTQPVKTGDIITVKHDVNNPDVVYNSYRHKIFVYIIIGLSCFLVSCALSCILEIKKH